jgi:hypothetical protein
MLCSVDELIPTTRLAEAAGPDEQSELVALEVCPTSAVPEVRLVPPVWPELEAHSTV